MTSCIYSSEFCPPSYCQHSSARISSLLRSHPPPAVPLVWFSPWRVIPSLPIWCLSIGAYRASPSNYTFFSVHPNPNHVDVPYRSIPFPCFPIRCVFAQVSPFFGRVTQHRRHLWFTCCFGLDFACGPFRFSLTGNTLSILPCLERILLRLRFFRRVIGWILTT